MEDMAKKTGSRAEEKRENGKEELIVEAYWIRKRRGLIYRLGMVAPGRRRSRLWVPSIGSWVGARCQHWWFAQKVGC
jgi:hypothetical protein